MQPFWRALRKNHSLKLLDALDELVVDSDETSGHELVEVGKLGRAIFVPHTSQIEPGECLLVALANARCRAAAPRSPGIHAQSYAQS
jgi:hypothetical protein